MPEELKNTGLFYIERKARGFIVREHDPQHGWSEVTAFLMLDDALAFIRTKLEALPQGDAK